MAAVEEILTRLDQLVAEERGLLVPRRAEITRWCGIGMSAADAVRLAFADEAGAYRRLLQLGIRIEQELRALDVAAPEWRARSDSLSDRTEQLRRVMGRLDAGGEYGIRES